MQKGKSPTSRPKKSNYTGRLSLKSSEAIANAYHDDNTGQLLEDTGGIIDRKLVMPFVAMLGTGSNTAISNVMAISLNKSIGQMTPIEKMGIVREGISKIDLEHLKNTAELDYDQLAWALSVTRATLINKKGAEKFSSSLSERIVSLADIYSYGYEVFDDDNKFNNWILRPNRALGGQTPYDLLDNQYGREEVRNLIGRIDYGVYS
jgi:putative toxin-antitoxin system antitoxin component (TIGR02293 family)